jgi:hypothetical protein
MATDVTAPDSANLDQAQAIANLQRSVDLLQQQLALQTEALVHLVRGQWDAAQFGPHSAEAFVVALNPALQGKVNAIPFDLAR